MKYKNRLSRFVMGGVLALALFASQAAAVTIPVANYADFKNKVLEGMADTFELTGHIDCNGDKNFRIIGKRDKPFIGVLKGNGKVIHNFKIDASGNGYAGLFGYLGKDAVIENLGVIADTVKGSFAVGILAGGSDGTIIRCFSKGVVRADGNSAGGLVGLNGGIISESYSEASIRGKDNVGGLVGMQTVNVFGAIIAYSYAKDGTVNGAGNVGGLVGYVFGGSIRQCLATGKVTGTSSVGGLIGYDYGSVSSDWKTSGKTGIGQTVQKADIVKCFWNEQTTGQKKSQGATGKNFSEPITTERMGNVNTYGDWEWGVWNREISSEGPLLLHAPSDPFGIPINGAQVTLSPASFVYNGAEQMPEITVLLDKVKPDYTIIKSGDDGENVSDGINAGVVEIKIAGKGKYGGEIDTSYIIYPKKETNIPPPTVAGQSHNSITITPVTFDNGYMVEYAISLTQEVPSEDERWGLPADFTFTGLAQNTTYYIFSRLVQGRNWYQDFLTTSLHVGVTTDVPAGYVFNPSADKESITLGESVTLSANVLPYDVEELRYQWYYNYFNIESYGGSVEIEGATSDSYTFTPTETGTRYYFVHVYDNNTEEEVFKNEEGIKVIVGIGKKSVSSAVTAPGAIVRGRTLVMSGPSSSGMQVRIIDMRGRTAARFVSNRGASFSLSRLPVGRYIVEVRDRGKRISALPVFLK
jgi:hypothetical protein